MICVGDSMIMKELSWYTYQQQDKSLDRTWFWHTISWLLVFFNFYLKKIVYYSVQEKDAKTQVFSNDLLEGSWLQMSSYQLRCKCPRTNYRKQPLDWSWSDMQSLENIVFFNEDNVEEKGCQDTCFIHNNCYMYFFLKKFVDKCAVWLSFASSNVDDSRPSNT